MKKTILILLSFLFFFTFIKVSDSRSEKAKIAHSIMYRVANLLETRYQLHYVAKEEAANKDKYTTIGLHFNKFGKISKDEGRKIIVDCINSLLDEINSNSRLQPFLINSPFTILNVDIVIIVFTGDGKSIFYPEIYVFSTMNGKIRYSTKSPDQKFGHFTEEEETFEEAVRIVEEQNKENSI